jgi:recombination protein U
MNNGKKFEQNFRKSIPDSPNIFYYRLKDGTANWKHDNITRFQANNIADSFLYYSGKLLILELKSHKGKSIPLNCIRKNQVEDMTLASYKTNVHPFLIVYFSDVERCFALSIQNYNLFIKSFTRKSIPIDYFASNGIEIKVEKLRSNCRYDIESFLDEI